ncbi:MAVS protein, partial [Turnix velox]|nr:MAVS protein [Turnix velox]
MGVAEDEVYKYILGNLCHFRNIHVASLADSLSCLTDADRDELHARAEMRGSQSTVYKFYQLLKCRQGWVLDLIRALHQNNAGHLADLLQDVYDSWQVRPQAPAAVFFPPAGGGGRATVTSIGAQMPSPRSSPALAKQPHQDLAVINCPPFLPGGDTVVSTNLDARAPVQESLPKNLPEQESPWLPLPKNTVYDGVSDGHSGEVHLPHPTKATQVTTGTPLAATVSVPSAATSECGREWLSRQQHPVCVDNGCFGNANHLQRGAPGLGLGRSPLLRDNGVAHSSEQPRNEPEEDVYISTESPPRPEEMPHSVEQQPPNSLSKKMAVPSSEHGDPPGSFVDVRSPLLIQQQFDAKQKHVEVLQEHGRDEDTEMGAATPAPRGTSPSHSTSLKPPVQEKKPPVEETASSNPSVLTKEKVALVDPVLTVTRSSEGKSERMAPQENSATCIWAPCNNVEREVELSKPGVLLSIAEERSEVTGRCPSSYRPSSPRSGACNMLTFDGDPILISTDSSSSGETLSRDSSGCPSPVTCEHSREEEAARASRNSSLSPSSHLSTSLRIHEVRVVHDPSIQLGSDSEILDGNPSDFVSNRSGSSVTSPSQARIPPADSSGPSLPYVVGIALLSVVVFLVFSRLQK